MRSLRLTALILLVCGASSPHVAQKAPKDPASAVKQYVSATATEVDRNASLMALSTMPRDQVLKALRGCFRNAKQRERALELAVALQLREAFEDAKKHLEAAPRKTADLGLLTAQKDAMDTLTTHWTTAQLDSPLFTAMQGAFTSYGVDVDALETFRISAFADTDEKRAEAALKVLAFQLGREIGSVGELKDSWADWIKADRDDGKFFPCVGISVMATRGWELIQDNVRGVGANCVLDDGGQIRFASKTPMLLDKGPFTFRLWIKASSDFEGWCGFVLKDKGGEFHVGASIKEGELAIPRDTSGMIRTTIKSDAWVKLEWSFKEKPGAQGFTMQCTFDEKILDTDGTIVGGAPLSFLAACNEGRIAIGGMDYIRN